MIIKTLFSNKKLISIFLKCRSEFFSNTKLICIFLWCKSEFFSNTKLICIFLWCRSEFFSNTKLICIFLWCRFEFFSNTKLICIFLRCKSEFFFYTQNWYVFSLYIDLYFSGHKTNLNFFFLSFLFYKIVDFEISKKKLRVRLKSFLLICDACIVSLSHECESFFKSLFLIYFTKTDLILQTKSHFF